MNTKYRALQSDRAQKLAESKKLLGADNPTVEDIAKAKELNAAIVAIDEQLAVFEATFNAERTAPAASVITVRERIEDDPKRGFANLADFALAVRSVYDPDLQPDSRINAALPTNYHKELGSDEGRMVPPAFKEQILEAISESDESLLSLVDSEPTDSNSVEFLRDESTPWGATGVQANWLNEGAQMTASKLATAADQLRLNKLYAYVVATEELLQDAPRLNARLTSKSALALVYKINEAIVNGDGVGKPLGWFTSSAKVSVAKEAAQVADTVVAANVAKMYARCINPGQGIWFVNQDVLPQLFTMTLGNNSVFVPPSSGFSSAPGGFLLGRPVRILENCQTVGDQGDIQFVNPKGYYAATKNGGPAFASSMHLFFDYDAQAFRWTFRVGGQPYLSAAISPAKGAVTRSHFVVLDARA